MFFSPDTDVLELVTANYDMLLKNTSVSITFEVVHIRAVWRALGPAVFLVTWLLVPKFINHLENKIFALYQKGASKLMILKLEKNFQWNVLAI